MGLYCIFILIKQINCVVCLVFLCKPDITSNKRYLNWCNRIVRHKDETNAVLHVPECYRLVHSNERYMYLSHIFWWYQLHCQIIGVKLSTFGILYSFFYVQIKVVIQALQSLQHISSAISVQKPMITKNFIFEEKKIFFPRLSIAMGI